MSEFNKEELMKSWLGGKGPEQWHNDFIMGICISAGIGALIAIVILIVVVLVNAY